MKIRIFTLILLLSAALAAGIPAGAQSDALETNPAAPTQEAGGVKNKLYAQLQVPLPFVATNCLLTDSQGAPVTDTQGQPVRTVCDLSDYISGVYRLAIGMAALFAVVMMIIAGYQWIFSGGGSDKISSAKKRIFGAAIGLMLALLSYVMLNAITPRLVALRLPDVEPVGRSIFGLTQTCQSNPAFAEYEQKNNISDGTLPIWPVQQSTESGRFLNRRAAKCGTMYSVEGDYNHDANTKIIGQCTGNVCDDQLVCFKGRCIDAIVHGDVTWNQAQNPLSVSDYLVSVELYRLCRGPLWMDIWKVAERDFDYQKPDFYRMPSKTDEPIDETCPLLTTYLGYALAVYVDDDYGETNNVFFVGNNCSAPFANRDDLTLARLDKDTVTADRLITSSALDAGFECNLDLTSAAFADYD